VAAVAAAVAGVVRRPAAVAAAAPPEPVRATGPPSAVATGAAAGSSAEELVDALRQARSTARKRKKMRHRAAKKARREEEAAVRIGADLGAEGQQHTFLGEAKMDVAEDFSHEQDMHEDTISDIDAENNLLRLAIAASTDELNRRVIAATACTPTSSASHAAAVSSPSVALSRGKGQDTSSQHIDIIRLGQQRDENFQKNFQKWEAEMALANQEINDKLKKMGAHIGAGSGGVG
jgi:hypothetical protein